MCYYPRSICIHSYPVVIPQRPVKSDGKVSDPLYLPPATLLSSKSLCNLDTDPATDPDNVEYIKEPPAYWCSLSS